MDCNDISVWVTLIGWGRHCNRPCCKWTKWRLQLFCWLILLRSFYRFGIISNVIVHQLQTPEMLFKESSFFRLSLITRLINFPNEFVILLHTYITANDVQLLKVWKYYCFSKLMPNYRKGCLLLVRNAYKVSVGNPERNENLRDLDVEGKIILRLILNK